MTPKVETWLVRFLENGQEVGRVHVQTVTRLFAQMLAYDGKPQFRRLGITTKVTRARSACPAALPACKKGDYVKC